METESSQVIAVVLGGAGQGEALAQSAGVASKSLIPIAGKPMASYVLEAVLNSATVERAVYVGEEGSWLPGAVRAVPAGRGYAQSLALGLGAAMALAPAGPILVVTADIPWLVPEAVDRFVRSADGLDLAYPIVPAEAALAAFPQQKRTFVRLVQGRFTGGNLLLLRPSMAAPLLELIDRVYRARKNPFALAGLVGPATLLAFMSGRADLSRLEALVSRRLGGVARAIATPDACLAADVDRLDQLPETITERS